MSKTIKYYFRLQIFTQEQHRRLQQEFFRHETGSDLPDRRMEVNGTMMPTSMYRHHDHHHHHHHHRYSHPPVPSYFPSSLHRGGLPPVDALAAGTTARSDAAAGELSPYYEDSPSGARVRGPQLPSAAAAAAAAAAASWRYNGSGTAAVSDHSTSSPHSNLQSCKLFYMQLYIRRMLAKTIYNKRKYKRVHAGSMSGR